MDNDIKPIVPQQPASQPGVNPTPVISGAPKPIVVTPGATTDRRPKHYSGGNHSGWRDLFSTVGILATAFGVALLLIAFVFRSYQVDGPSMQNTLQNTDKLIIWKVPRTIARITHHQYVPSRGDIIVFTESGLSQYGQENTKQLIKRVIGLPGERVVVSNGVYTIYNKANPKGFDPDKTLSYFDYGKTMPVTSGDIDVTLKSNQIFVSGDNRPDSLDSRAFGPISADQVIGKLIIRVFPINTARIF